MHTIFNWLLAACIALVMAASFHLDGGSTKLDPDMLDRAEAQLCFRIAGFGSVPTRGEDGALWCKPRRGKSKGVRVDA